MTNLSNLCGIQFKLQRTMSTCNIFAGYGFKIILKVVNRDYSGRTKKPLYFLSLITDNRTQYLTGLFSTNDPLTFSGDYKDALGMKHIVKASFADGGKALSLKAVA